MGGLTGGEVEIRMAPNQGIWRSARSAAMCALIVGLGGGLCVGLIFGVFVSLFAEQVLREAPDRFFSLGSALGGALIYGGIVAIGSASTYAGYACLLHFALRLTLWSHKAIPWNYARFLDYAS